MCLAVPGQVLSLQGETAQVDFHGNRRAINMLFAPEAAEGDWVLVHAGFAIWRLDEAEAKKTWHYLNEMNLLTGEPDASIDR